VEPNIWEELLLSKRPCPKLIEAPVIEEEVMPVHPDLKKSVMMPPQFSLVILLSLLMKILLEMFSVIVEISLA